MQWFARISFESWFLGERKGDEKPQNRVKLPLEECADLSSNAPSPRSALMVELL